MIKSKLNKLGDRIIPSREQGAALVVTLLVVVLFATIVAGFLSATRLEQTASRNFTYQNVAEHMAQLGAQQAVAQLNRDVGSSLTTTTAIATLPGGVVRNGSVIPLSSASAPGIGSNSTNMNFISSMSGLGVIHSNTNANLFTVPLVNVTNSMHGNDIYGRFGYWIDDDGSRANLNSMVYSTNTNSSARTNFIPNYPVNTSVRILDSTIFTNRINNRSAKTVGSVIRDGIINSFTNTDSTNPWSYIITPRQTFSMNGITTTNSQEMLTQVTAGPANLGNLWNYTNANLKTKKINLNENLTPLRAGIIQIPRNFITNAMGSRELTTEINSIITQKIDRQEILDRFQSGFQAKYGQDVMRQIVVNINDLSIGASSNASSPTYPTGSANTNSDGIPSQYSGLRNFVYLNEAATRVAYNPRTLAIAGQGNSSCEVQIWLKFELVNPFPTTMGNQAEINFKIDNFSATATYVSSNGTRGSATLSRATVPALGPQSGTTVVNQNVSPRSYLPASGTGGTSTSGNLTFGLEYQFFEGNATHNIPAGATAITVSNVSFQISHIKLLQSAANNGTICDWAVAQDFAGHGAADGTLTFSGASVPQVSTSLKQGSGATLNFQAPAAGIQDFNTGPVLGIAKNDPRVRRFPDWANPLTAWFPVTGGGNPPITFGNQNSVVNFTESSGIAKIPADRLSQNPATIWAHPSFSRDPTATNFRSLVDLGYVHTGLQWRTLHMASQNPTEIGNSLIPDWALLDTFYLTNNIQANIANPIVKINVNSVHYPAANTLSLQDQVRAGLLRPLALQTLLSAGSNSTAATYAGIPAASVMTSGESSPATLASNLSLLNFNRNWAARRAGLGATNFPSNAFSSIGEVLEIRNVADFSQDDAVNEGRAASFIDAITTHSDIFSIYSIGYAVDRTGATVAEFALRTQVQFDPVIGRFKTVFSEPLR